MNTFSKGFTRSLVAAAIALTGLSAQAAQGEQYQFTDGPRVQVTASNPVVHLPKGAADLPIQPRA